MADSPPQHASLSNSDPRLSGLRAALRRLQVRFRLQEAARLVPVAMTLGLGATCLLAVAWRAKPWLAVAELLAAGVGLVAAASLVALGYSLLRPRDLMATARLADRMLALDERLSTALEDATRAPSGQQSPLFDAQLEDALQAALAIVPTRDLPLKAHSASMVPGALVMLLVMAVLFIPSPFSPQPDRTAQAQVTAEQKNIEALQKAIQAQPRANDDPNLQALLKELSQLSRDLSQNDLTREEALARLSDTESHLQKALDPQAAAQREALDQLAKQLASSNSQPAKEVGDALKSGDAQKAADALKKAGQDASSMTSEERKALSQSLNRARDQVAPLDPSLASRLNDAAGAIESNDPKAAQDALNNLGQQVKDTSDQVATQQQIQQALAQIQQSKTNIARAGQPTAVADANQSGTAQAYGTAQATAGTVQAGGSPVPGTVVALGTSLSGTPLASVGSPVSGTPVALGSPMTGQPAQTGTPVLVQGTPGSGTPVAVPGNGAQGQTQGQGQPNGGAQTQGQAQGQGQAQAGNAANGNPGSGGGQGGSNWGVGHQEPVYAPPSSVNAALTPVVVQGQESQGGEQSSAGTSTDANGTGPALVPYEQVYGQYQQQAGQALGSDYIPQGYKDLVRDYFSKIAPQSQP